MSAEDNQGPQPEGLKKRSMEDAAWLIIISDDSPTIQDLLMRLSDKNNKASAGITDDPVELANLIVKGAKDLASQVAAGRAPIADAVESELGVILGDVLVRVLKLSYQNGIDPLRAAGNRLA